MTHTEATAIANTRTVDLVDRDATGSRYVSRAAWLRDGILVIAHPTDPARSPIPAPVDGRYELSA